MPSYPVHEISKQSSSRPSKWLFYCILTVIGLAIVLLYAHQERTFYHWDSATYQEFTRVSAQAFSESPRQGVKLVYASMNEDHNLLFTLPLVPFFLVLGPHRATFVSAIFLVYFVPFMLLVAALARRVFPQDANHAARIAAILTLATPICWVPILRGYPDIGGVAIMVVMLLLYDRSDGAVYWKQILAIGFIGGLVVLFRRHFAYAVIALYAAFGIDLVIRNFAVWVGRSWSAKTLLKPALHLVCMGILTATTVYASAPAFARRSLSSDYRHLLTSWEDPPFMVLESIVGTLGLSVLLLAAVGLCLLSRVTKPGGSIVRVLLLGTGIWIPMWIFLARQSAFHYQHLLPLTVVLGLTSLWLVVHKSVVLPKAQYACYSAITAILFLNVFIAVPLTKLAAAMAQPLPRFTTADPTPPIVNPAYDEIVRLVAYLRVQAEPTEGIVVGASSFILNEDILSRAEQTIYGRQNSRLLILSIAPVDSFHTVPLDELMQARFVLIGRPFQHHLRREEQKVVEVLVSAFDKSWKVTEDFERMPQQFTLGEPGTEIVVYRRIRPSSSEVIRDTAQRMFDFVNRPDAEKSAPPIGFWTFKSSVYPVNIFVLSDGMHRIIAHPVREQQYPETVVEMTLSAVNTLKLSGEVHFYDERCVGAEIVVGTDYKPGLRGTSVGVFTPQRNDSHFEITVPNAKGKELYLNVKSTPRDPQNINYCRLEINGLRSEGW